MNKATGGPIAPKTKNQQLFDVAVIGAGVVGTAIARELAKYKLTSVVIEAKNDVGKGTSKANTAILHTGFDTKPNTLEIELVQRGYELLHEHGPALGIPIEKTGAVMVAWNEEQFAALPGLLDHALDNGVTDVEILSADEVYRREKNLGLGVLGGLLVPGESITCTFTVPLAFATEAVANGVKLMVNTRVEAIASKDEGMHEIVTNSGMVYTRYVVNAAGLWSDELNRIMGYDEFNVTPRRGEELVFDKSARRLIQHIILAVPTRKTKGVLVTPTIYGNVLLGPTAEDLTDKTDTSTTEGGLKSLINAGKNILPDLTSKEITAAYAGLRAATEHSDYQISLHGDKRYVCVGGIRSTGLSASMGIAEYVLNLLAEGDLVLERKTSVEQVKMPNLAEISSRPYQMNNLIAEDADLGSIVCFCERVTVGEIVAACRTPVPPQDIDGLKRRTRATMGRCQGNYCLSRVIRLLAQANGKPVSHYLGLGEDVG